MLLALAGTKGGTGKTTLALALAEAAAMRGRRVLVIDTDPRTDCLSWRLAADRETPTVLGLFGEQLPGPDALRALGYGHDLTVIDTPASDPEALEQILCGCDHALVPVGPCAMEFWAVADTLDAVIRARECNPQLRVSLLMNRVDRRTTLGRSLPADLGQLGLPVLRTRVHSRAIHAEAMAHGATACSYDPATVAAQELLELSEEIEQHVHHTSFAARLAH